MTGWWLSFELKSTILCARSIWNFSAEKWTLDKRNKIFLTTVRLINNQHTSHCISLYFIQRIHIICTIFFFILIDFQSTPNEMDCENVFVFLVVVVIVGFWIEHYMFKTPTHALHKYSKRGRYFFFSSSSSPVVFSIRFGLYFNFKFNEITVFSRPFQPSPLMVCRKIWTEVTLGLKTKITFVKFSHVNRTHGLSFATLNEREDEFVEACNVYVSFDFCFHMFILYRLTALMRLNWKKNKIILSLFFSSVWWFRAYNMKKKKKYSDRIEKCSTR